MFGLMEKSRGEVGVVARLADLFRSHERTALVYRHTIPLRTFCFGFPILRKKRVEPSEIKNCSAKVFLYHIRVRGISGSFRPIGVGRWRAAGVGGRQKRGWASI